MADSGSRGRESCRGPCNLNTAGHNEHSGRAQRARNNNILRLKASWTKNIEYQILREWTLEQPSQRATTWKLITAARHVFLVFTTWGDRPEIRFWSQKNITHVIVSRYNFSKILLKNVQTHLLDLIYYIRYFHTFLVKSHGHRGPCALALD